LGDEVMEIKSDKKVTIDFSNFPKEYEWLVNNAQFDCRPLDWEIISIIKDIVDGKWEYQT
jgi:hypothetical protein